jgi:hypothetical protein
MSCILINVLPPVLEMRKCKEYTVQQAPLLTDLSYKNSYECSLENVILMPLGTGRILHLSDMALERKILK